MKGIGREERSEERDKKREGSPITCSKKLVNGDGILWSSKCQ